MLFESGEDVVPERGFLGGLNLRQIKGDGRPGACKLAAIIDDVKHQVDDGCRKAFAAGEADMPVVEVQASGTKYLCGEVQLLAPVADDRTPEEVLTPLVHLRRDLFGGP